MANNKSSYGYGKRPLWQWIVIYLVIGAIVYGLIYYFVIAKKGGYGTYSPNGQKTITKSTTSTSGTIYMSKVDAIKGKYLVDFQGMTIYTFDKDTSGVSNCYNGCATTWPPYTSGSTAESNLPENITIVKRTDGSTQFAWKEMPLYHYVTDQKPGDITGDGVGEVWHIIKL